MKLTTAALVSALAIGVGTMIALAQAGKHPVDQPTSPPKPSDTHQPMMPDEMKKMMEEYRKANMPGPEHEVLRRLIGEWKVHSKVFPGPGAPPMESRGEAEGEAEYDGRFVELEADGEMMGQPWNGKYLLGYDRFKKHYTIAMWSNVTTAMNHGTGSYDDASKTITYDARMDDAHGDRPTKFAIRFNADGTHVIEAYDTVPGMGQIRVMEAVFTKDD